jgi:hypothetical protein
MKTIVGEIIRTFALAVVPPHIIDNNPPARVYRRHVRG